MVLICLPCCTSSSGSSTPAFASDCAFPRVGPRRHARRCSSCCSRSTRCISSGISSGGSGSGSKVFLSPLQELLKRPHFCQNKVPPLQLNILLGFKGHRATIGSLDKQRPVQVRSRKAAVIGFWGGEDTDIGDGGDMEEPFRVWVVGLGSTGR